MQKLIILAAFAACCIAAPFEDLKHPAISPLERPSPINPDVPMASKPAEKITMITDLAELEKHSPASEEKSKPAQLLPTVSPTVHDHTVVPVDHKDHAHQHHRQKRDGEVVIDSKKVQPLKQVEKSTSTTSKAVAVASSTTPRRTYRPRTTPAPKKPEPLAEVLTQQRSKREVEHSSSTPAAVATLPLIFRDDNKQHHVASAPHHVEPQVPRYAVHTDAKRDIPVPLVPKHPHPEESPKEEESDAKKKAEVKQQKAVENQNNSKNKEDQSIEEPNKEQHKQDAQAKVSVKRENVQVEALHDLTVPLHKPNEQQQESHEQQPHNDHHLQHHPLEQHPHVAAQQKQFESQQQHVAQDELSHHTHEHHAQQQHHSFQPEHPHIATQQHVEAAATVDSAPTSTSSTTEHPLFRTKPVPVAELFARPHQQQ